MHCIYSAAVQLDPISNPYTAIHPAYIASGLNTEQNVQFIPQLGRHTHRRRQAEQGRHTRTQRKGGLPHCQFAKLQFYGFAFICTAGIKSGELLQFKSRFAESGASAVSTLLQSGFNLAAKVSILVQSGFNLAEKAGGQMQK